MKTAFNFSTSHQIFRNLILIFAFILSLVPRAHAGLNCEMNVVRYHQYGFYFFPNVTTNGVLDLPYGTYCFTSYGWPTNGTSSIYQFDSTGFNQVAGGSAFGYGYYDDMVHELTNGTWFVYLTNSVTTNIYHFKVTANITSGDLPYVDITYPADGTTGVPNNATFTWQGPTDYGDLIVYQGPNSTFLPITQTSWQPPTMPDGSQSFTPHYDSNSTTAVISSQPVNSLSQPISSWSSTDHLQDYSMSTFTVGSADTAGTVHTLVAYYPFDSSSSFVLDGTTDASGNGYNMSFAAGYGAQGGATLTSDSEAGIGAVQFSDGDGSSGGVIGWSQPTPAALLNALSGSFTVSCWVKTSQSIGFGGDAAYNGAGIVCADVNGQANDTVPIGLTGGQVAFTTGGDQDDTVTSQASVNDGYYHHIVVTRNQETGQKLIYVDGVLDNFAIGTTNLLNDPQKLTIGAVADAGDPNPDDLGYYNGYDGELDDLQIYSGCLSSNDVATLFNNPGTTIPNGGGGDNFNDALGTTGLNWSTSGDSNWFTESTNTYNGAPLAAQSGIVQDDQSSVLSVTVTGPGTLTFAWSCQASGNFDYEFDIDGNYQDDIFGDTDWFLELDPNSGYNKPFVIPAGQHTLTWTTYAYGDEDPTEAGFLDNVSFNTETTPQISLNPFDQTNYPGYSVWLDAGVTDTNNVTWQWYEVGVGAIPGATNPYLIPTNSGTAGVAGSYYVIASNDSGSTISSTALVTFVSAPLPPAWSTAFKSPFQAEDESQATRDYYYGCCLDPNGNIYAASEFGGDMAVGSLELNSGPNDAAAIVKQAQDGTTLWAVGITNNGNGAGAYAECVAPAPGGGVYLAGNYHGDNWLNTNHLTDAGGGDMFVASFDGNGSNRWVKTFGGTNTDFLIINSLASDPSGNVAFCGLVGSGPVTIGTSNYVASGQEGIVVQLDQTGAVRWSQLLPAEWVQYITYSAGRLYLSVNSSVNNGTTNVVIGGTTNLTDRSWAVACLNDTTGQAIWVRGVGALSGSSSGNPYAVGLIDDVPRLAISGTNVFITGVAYATSASFSNLTVTFSNPRGEYVARYNTNGTPIVAMTFGSVSTTPIAAAANAKGELYVSGDFDNYSYFGNPLIAAPEETQIQAGNFSQAFLAKFDINGNPLWAKEATSPVTVNFLGIAADTNGVWASGWGQAGGPPAYGPIRFGTNSFYSDRQFLTGPAGGGTLALFYPGGVLAKVTDTASTALPVTLLNVADSGANLQFQFLSESGFSHDVLYRTNLQVGNWQTYSTVSGDGTLKTILIPLSTFGNSRQGFVRVTTH
ncbi:MAG TPA: LamG domain-containing protein [Pseudomonadales bacterium]|nr:LamG domain-containing protein [Pseudomonadales bacterium]